MKKLSLLFLLTVLFVLPALTGFATAPITGFPIACVGTETPLYDATTGGLWSSTNPSVATVGLTSGIVTGVSIGTATISYNVSGISAVITVTINAAPFAATVSGPSELCAGASLTLTDPVPGGTWSSGSPVVASVDGSGNVTGISGGTASISYSVSNSSCTVAATHIVTVHALPPAGVINGAGTVCAGSTLLLSDAAIGGVWSSSTVGVATITPAGMVTGISSGTTTISYTITSVFGCVSSATAMVRVNPAPITGFTTICVSNITTLADASPGGTWSSSNNSIAGIGSSSGIVNGISAGTVNISYTLPAGCFVTTPVLVQPALSPIAGPTTICGATTIALTDASGGGVWTSGNPGIATIDLATGAVMGIASGVTFITYSLNPGCTATLAVTVSPVPPPFNVTGGGSYCEGGVGVPIGLNGSISGTMYQLFYGTTLVNSLSGTGGALNYGLYIPAGDYTVLATNMTSGCANYMTGSATVVITSLSTPLVSIVASPGTTVCEGTTVLFTAAPILGGPTPAYSWSVNGLPVTGSGATLIYLPANSDTITVLLKSDADCLMSDSTSTSVTMTVTPILVPSATISASPGDSVCPGTVVTFSVTPVDAGTSPTLHWRVNGIFSGSGPTYAYAPVMGDNIYCELISSYSCPSIDSLPSSNFISMNVPPIFVPDVLVIANPGNRIAHGEPVIFTAEVLTLGGIIESYQWEINSVPVPGATSDTFSSNALNNRDTVKCLVTGSSTCGLGVGSDQIIIIDTIALLDVNNSEYKASDISLIPNPNKGSFNVKGIFYTTTESAAITITDMMGQVIYKDIAAITSGKLNTEIKLNGTLAAGIYLLNVKTEAENKVFHFVIE